MPNPKDVKGALTDAQAKKLIDTDSDFINCRRLGNSLKTALERYPDGCPDRVISQALGIPEGEIEAFYERVVGKLRDLVGA